MGPSTLFDKSFLQSLNIDESVWFDMFFSAVICPIFYYETIADLKKIYRDQRPPASMVKSLAQKTPELNSQLNTPHIQICHAELLQQATSDMGRRPVVSGGIPVRSGTRTGIRVEEPPERKAFHNWQRGNFSEVDRICAEQWRAFIELLDPRAGVDIVRKLGAEPEKCRTLEDAKIVADSIAFSATESEERFSLVLHLLRISPSYRDQIISLWNEKKCPTLKEFSRYAAFLLTVDVFYYIAECARLFSKRKNTDQIDVSYLYYLPFCMIFVSSDKLHKEAAPFFMNDDQKFVWGLDLKNGLAEIDAYFSRLPTEAKELGLHAIAPRPPTEIGNVVTSLWDFFFPTWRDRTTKLISPPKKWMIR